MASTRLQQIRVAIDHPDDGSLTTEADFAREQDGFQANLIMKCPAHIWPKGSYRAACPRPILVTGHHEQRVTKLSQALTSAVNDIVERWWSDQEARLFERMPLKREEEDILKWIESQVSCGTLKKYSDSSGSWRPDFLIEDRISSQEADKESFLITEINGRFSFNGAMHLAYGQEVFDDMDLGVLKLTSTATPAQIFDGLRSLFNPCVPLHLLIGEEAGIDIHMFIDASRKRFGITPRLINPSDLRLEPALQGNREYRLCCLAQRKGDTEMFPLPSTFINNKGEILEEIQQVGLELHQHELFALPHDMLRHISLCCFNDLRTILLAHDKRMLGIVKQELQYLVQAQVLTPDQAQALDEGIVDTFIPGSPQIHSLLQKSKNSLDLKNDYILKPIRSGKGAGIIFGEDIASYEWESILENLQSRAQFTEKTYVVQRRVEQPLYDLVLHASGNKVHYPLVGTWHIINGMFCGLGTWRSSANRICAVSSGGAILWSVSETLSHDVDTTPRSKHSSKNKL
ncbi:hypothetical protein EV127DRAFT_331792 [Xylaria flabelliformis]|nr:hypothetical protein EV127DRAFT_331792 [Xylaria flabelliformis]